MDTNPEHGITSGKPPAPRPDENIGIRHHFPGEMPAASGAPESVKVPTKNVFTGIILPAIVFIFVIGGIAWVTQYMPGRTKVVPQNLQEATTEPILRFDEVKAIWDPEDKDYVAEFESSDDGYFDFPFENPRDDNVLLGALQLSCVCSQASVALVPTGTGEVDSAKLSFQVLEANGQPEPKKAITVPPQSRGVVRLSWKGGRLKDPLSRMHAAIWTQAEKKPADKQKQVLETMVRIVQPIMADPMILRVGDITAGSVTRAETLLWSATRSELDLVMKPEIEDGLVEVQVTPLTLTEREELEDKLRAVHNTRIKSAYRASITVHEQRNNKQFPQGPFRRDLVVMADMDKVPAPVISGLVQGEVQLAGSDAGTLKLDHFAARQGTKRRATLWTENSIGLEFESQQPGYMKVKLAENKKESTSNRRRWDLDIEIPPGTPVGPLPVDSVIILKTQSASPRQIHIPIRGTATPG